MLDGPRISLRAHAAKPLPVEAMVLGKSRVDVAELLPRLFNLCRAAQSMAVRQALGLDAGDDESDALRREIIRDHVLRLAVVLPGHFGQGMFTLPRGWQSDTAALRQVLFGPTGQLPETPTQYQSFLKSGAGLAALWVKLGDLFADGEAEVSPLPFVSDATGGTREAQVENSCAERVFDHPVVAELGKDRRSLLWRVVARSYDLQALLDGAPLQAHASVPGTVHVPATRGLYTVSARHDGERVTSFSRVTPTDHLQAPGGVLDQTLASLPATRAAVVPLVMDILDPCAPIQVDEVQHA